MRLCDVNQDTIVKVFRIDIERIDIVRRLKEIGVAADKNIRFIKKSKISKCILIESLGSVFILDKYISERVICYE